MTPYQDWPKRYSKVPTCDGSLPVLYDDLERRSLTPHDVAYHLNVYHYDLCRVAEKLKEKGLEKEGETPLGTMLRLLEEGFPQAGAVSQEQVPAEANCATGLQPLPLKAQALASAIIDLNRHLDGMMKWNEFLKKEITDALDCRRLLVNALANCES